MSSERFRAEMRESPSGLVSGLATKLTEIEGAVRRQADRFSAVLDIGAQISQARDVDHLLGVVMDRLSALLGAEAATLFMYDEAQDELWSRVLRGSTLKEIRLPSNKGIAGHVFTSGKSLLLEDAYADIRFNPEIDKQSGFRTRSMIAVPLKHVSGRTRGVLEVLHRRINAFNPEDRALVEGVATQIAAVLDNVLLLEQLRKQNEKLEAAGAALTQAVRDLEVLYEVEKVVSSVEEQADLVDKVLAKAISVVGARAGSVLLAEEDQDALFFRSARGEKSEGLVQLRLPAGKGIAGHVASTREVVRVKKAEESEHYEKGVAKKLGVPVNAVLAVPIVSEGRTLGALELLNKPSGFTETDERLAVLLAGQAGRAITLQRSREVGERRNRLEAIGQMLAGVMHDLRTPMTVIAGYAEMLAEEEDPKVRKESSEVILAQLEHLNAMTRETLAFARGEVTVLMRKVYLHAWVKELTALLEQEFQNSKCELVIDLQYKGAARFDETKLRRLVFNLARNALEAMPKGGKFTLAVEKDGDQLVLRASDNGPGIPPEIADKLFQHFVTARKKNGTGLGLALVKTIAEEHGGTVTFESRPGKGTMFEVRFPLGLPRD
ncbi:MAG: GAF domain-containing sensor histidine kinase [Myxococcaceae bacterium]|nr:GAF domain-containing sensor histidine kinase [Myxococcaceae bacterium]